MVKLTLYSRARRIHAKAYDALEQSKLLCRSGEFDRAQQLLEEAATKMSTIGQFIEALHPLVVQTCREILDHELKEVNDTILMCKKKQKPPDRPLSIFPEKSLKASERSESKKIAKRNLKWPEKLFWDFFTTTYRMMLGIEGYRVKPIAVNSESSVAACDLPELTLDSLPVELLVMVMQYLEVKDLKSFASTAYMMNEIVDQHRIVLKKGRFERVRLYENNEGEFTMETFNKGAKEPWIHKVEPVSGGRFRITTSKNGKEKSELLDFEEELNLEEGIIGYMIVLMTVRDFRKLYIIGSRVTMLFVQALMNTERGLTCDKITVEIESGDDLYWVYELIDTIFKNGSLGDLCVKSENIISSDQFFHFIGWCNGADRVVPTMELNFKVDSEMLSDTCFSIPIHGSVASAFLLYEKWFEHDYRRVLFQVPDMAEFWTAFQQYIGQCTVVRDSSGQVVQILPDNSMLNPKPFERRRLVVRYLANNVIFEDYSFYLMSDRCKDGICDHFNQGHQQLLKHNVGVLEVESKDSYDWARQLDAEMMLSVRR